EDLPRALQVMEKMRVEVVAAGVTHDPTIGRVSLVGAGMKSHPGVAARMFEVLAAEDVNIEMISTSAIRISCVVHEDDVATAVRALHRAFDLDDAGEEA
ncbi:MAG: ACT domain-containing protein, partial [Acidimicrobiia bacterium]